MNTNTFESQKLPSSLGARAQAAERAQRGKYLEIMAGLTFAGVLFSGYLSAVNLLSGSCAFNESCPLFLGYPACFYGFGMFATMFGVTMASLFRKFGVAAAAKAIAGFSLAGIVFAGHFVWAEGASWLATPETSYKLVLPTCVYGLVFYVIIFVGSLLALKKFH